MSKVVTNTSPLIVMVKAGLLHVLPEIFEEIAVPVAVIDEIAAGPADDPMRLALPAQSWLRLAKLEPALSPVSALQLGSGEAEAIEFARRNPGWDLLVDDRAARRAASALGITVLGTLTVIAIAADRQLIDSFDVAIVKLRKAGLFVTDELVESVRQKLQNQ
jgi:predicted nucleic acid-binding protein